MSKDDNLFAVLGLPEACTNDEVKAAYFKLAKQWHPDVNSSPSSSTKFKQISNAYEVLKTDRTRSEYLARLHQESGSYQSSWTSHGSSSGYETSHGDKWNATRKLSNHWFWWLCCLCLASYYLYVKVNNLSKGSGTATTTASGQCSSMLWLRVWSSSP